MVRSHQGVHSTRNNREAVLDTQAQVNDMNPPQEARNMQDDEMFCFTVLVDQNEATIYSDLTGRFPT